MKYFKTFFAVKLIGHENESRYKGNTEGWDLDPLLCCREHSRRACTWVKGKEITGPTLHLPVEEAEGVCSVHTCQGLAT